MPNLLLAFHKLLKIAREFTTLPIASRQIPRRTDAACIYCVARTNLFLRTKKAPLTGAIMATQGLQSYACRPRLCSDFARVKDYQSLPFPRSPSRVQVPFFKLIYF